MSPENELLLFLAGLDGADHAVHLRKLVARPLDWDRLLNEANRHGLLSFLYLKLSQSCATLVPSDVLARLREDYLQNSRSNLYLVKELLKIQKLLASKGIKSLAFKGPLLSALAYGDLALRRAGDLDVLIHPEAFQRAADLLAATGYAMSPPLTGRQNKAHLKFHCEIQFFDEAQFSVVDLHWALAPKTFPFALPVEEVFARSQCQSVGGEEIETFGREDLLVYLCMHGAKHYWSRLEWVSTIAQLIRAEAETDWSLVADLARQTRSEKILALAFILARELFSVAPPCQVALTNDETLQEFARNLSEKLQGGPVKQPTQWQMFKMNLRMLDRKRDAWFALARSILVPTISDWESLALPAPLYPLYYLLRPIRLVTKHASSNQPARPDSVSQART